jgi:hypothetical protein
MASAPNDHLTLNSVEPIINGLISARLRAWLGLKLLLLVLLSLWVYVPYLYLQKHHFFAVTVMPEGALDHMIPFASGATWLYLSIYLLIPIGPFLMKEHGQILRYATGIVLTGLCADIIFIFWPTVCIRPGILGTNAAYQFLTTIDNSYHAFPSLHAAFAAYSALCGGMMMRELGRRAVQAGLWLWAGLILYATLATKQHVTADIIAGAALGFGVYACVFPKWLSMFKSSDRGKLSPST